MKMRLKMSFDLTPQQIIPSPSQPGGTWSEQSGVPKAIGILEFGGGSFLPTI
jgi:hypothetical protein